MSTSRGVLVVVGVTLIMHGWPIIGTVLLWVGLTSDDEDGK